jgi:hypothetical protein
MAEQRKHDDLASAMYPALSREAKARDAAAAQWRAEQKTRTAKLLEGLRELNRKIDARMAREADALSR